MLLFKQTFQDTIKYIQNIFKYNHNNAKSIICQKTKYKINNNSVPK